MLSIDTYEALLRISASLISGLLIGFSRMKYPAGIRTFALICVSSTIYTIVSIDPIFSLVSPSDPTRVIAQIVTGIGFLGAGVIWKTNAKVSGLTTAAAIWVTASVGILIGLGNLLLGMISLALVLIVLYSKKYLEPI